MKTSSFKQINKQWQHICHRDIVRFENMNNEHDKRALREGDGLA